MGNSVRTQRLCCGDADVIQPSDEAQPDGGQSAQKPQKHLRVNFMEDAKDDLDEAVGVIHTHRGEQLKHLARKEQIEKGSNELSATHKTGSRTGLRRSAFDSARFSDKPEPDPEHSGSGSPEQLSASKLRNLRARFSTTSIRMIMASISDSSLGFDTSAVVPANPICETAAALQRQLGELSPEQVPEVRASYSASQQSFGPFLSPKSGATYIGQLAGEAPDGWGRIVSAKGSLIEGWFEKGELSRFARIIDSRGSVYVGGIANKTWHGRGRLVDSAGLQVESCWVDGQAHGPTQVFDRHGQLVFKGNVVRGLKSGQGFLANPGQQFRYEGNFENDRFEGRGIKIHGDGSVYEGQFSNGLENGQGTIKFVDGREWAGKFVKGVPHGPGTLTTDTGERRNCAYYKGRRIPQPAE